MNTNLDFRPKTYFIPHAVEEYLVARVKGDILRQKIITLVDSGEYQSFEDIFNVVAHLPEFQSHLEILAPHFMGGTTWLTSNRMRLKLLVYQLTQQLEM